MEDRFLSKGQQMTNTNKEEKGGAVTNAPQQKVPSMISPKDELPARSVNHKARLKTRRVIAIETPYKVFRSTIIRLKNGDYRLRFSGFNRS